MPDLVDIDAPAQTSWKHRLRLQHRAKCSSLLLLTSCYCSDDDEEKCNSIWAFSNCCWLLSVSQLRGHWEDTSSKVSARKAQLEDLAVDHQNFESKNQEIDAWLIRMEGWQARQRPVGATKDVLEQQTRELKVSRAVW